MQFVNALSGTFCFFLLLISGPFFFAVKFQKCFEHTIFISTASIVLLLFLGGIIGFLLPSVYIVMGLALLFLLFSAFQVIKTHSLRKLNIFFTPSFLCFSLIFFFLFYAHYGRLVVHSWDEFSHWGDVVKAMTYIDDLSTNPSAHLSFPSYPPGMALFQYLFQKIIMHFNPDNSFMDWGLYFSYHLFAHIAILSFFHIKAWKSFFPVFLLFLCVELISCFLFNEYLTTIYIDPFVSILAASGFAFLYLMKNRKSSPEAPQVYNSFFPPQLLCNGHLFNACFG